METVLKLKISELDNNLLSAIKKAFAKDHSIEIVIRKKKEKKDILIQETREKYFTRLKKAAKNIENGNVISFTGEEFKALSKVLGRNTIGSKKI